MNSSVTIIRDHLNQICTLTKDTQPEAYKLACEAMLELIPYDYKRHADYFRPDVSFNLVGKVVVRDEKTGKVTGVQG
jgi:hypothetical protein